MIKRRHAAALVPAGLLTALPAAAQRYDGMHGMWDSHFGWGHMLLGGLVMVLVLAAVVGLIAVLARGSWAAAARHRPRVTVNAVAVRGTSSMSAMRGARSTAKSTSSAERIWRINPSHQEDHQMIRHLGRLAMVTALLLPGAALAATATVHKTPTCGCCDAYAEHLEGSGFDVETIDHDSMDPVFREARVVHSMASCHLTEIGPYTVVGHVPAAVIQGLVSQRPMIRGISLPGMPAGSPGMGGEKQEPFTIYRLGAKTDAPEVYDRY